MNASALGLLHGLQHFWRYCPGYFSPLKLYLQLYVFPVNVTLIDGIILIKVPFSHFIQQLMCLKLQEASQVVSQCTTSNGRVAAAWKLLGDIEVFPSVPCFGVRWSVQKQDMLQGYCI